MTDRTKKITIRVTADEIAAFKANAQRQGKSYATLVRELAATGKSTRASAIAAEQWSQLATFQAELRQLSRTGANPGGAVNVDWIKAGFTLQRLEALLTGIRAELEGRT
jgi:hypothetical protein